MKRVQDKLSKQNNWLPRSGDRDVNNFQHARIAEERCSSSSRKGTQINGFPDTEQLQQQYGGVWRGSRERRRQQKLRLYSEGEERRRRKSRDAEGRWWLCFFFNYKRAVCKKSGWVGVVTKRSDILRLLQKPLFLLFCRRHHPHSNYPLRGEQPVALWLVLFSRKAGKKKSTPQADKKTNNEQLEWRLTAMEVAGREKEEKRDVSWLSVCSMSSFRAKASHR